MKNNKKNKSIIILDMVFYEDDESKQETEHLLSTETNKKRLLEDVSKQETTLEEDAFNFTAGKSVKEIYSRMDFVKGAKFGAKWQQEQDKNKYSEKQMDDAYDKGFKDASERMYSEEDMINFAQWFSDYEITKSELIRFTNQLKNK